MATDLCTLAYSLGPQPIPDSALHGCLPRAGCFADAPCDAPCDDEIPEGHIENRSEPASRESSCDGDEPCDATLAFETAALCWGCPLPLRLGAVPGEVPWGAILGEPPAAADPDYVPWEVDPAPVYMGTPGELFDRLPRSAMSVFTDPELYRLVCDYCADLRNVRLAEDGGVRSVFCGSCLIRLSHAPQTACGCGNPRYLDGNAKPSGPVCSGCHQYKQYLKSLDREKQHRQRLEEAGKRRRARGRRGGRPAGRW